HPFSAHSAGEAGVEGFTHDWMVFVQGPETGDIQHFVEKIVFCLHGSYPREVRREDICMGPPYKVEETGSAGFFMDIDIFLKNKVKCMDKSIKTMKYTYTHTHTIDK
uniref:YEATS domain-containing protein n=1 Tax=Lates calcarifer TaxID=8187 RepID=A0A4W6CV30_LATCA